jgi:hypothetical protein
MLKCGRRKWLGAAGSSGGAARIGSAGKEKTGLTCGSHMSVTMEERRHFTRMCKPKGKTPFGKYAKASLASWA